MLSVPVSFHHKFLVKCLSLPFDLYSINNYLCYTWWQCFGDFSGIPCTENTIQLIGSPIIEDNSMGRVEVCVDGILRRVTSSGFESSHAAAVCKQLGRLTGNM